MKAIFDRQGYTVAWLKGQFAFDLKGDQLSLYRDYESVFSLNGKYLGYFSSGFFRDKHGYAVAFVNGATAGPDLPELQLVPIAPLLSLPLYPALPSLPPVPAIAKLEWSRLGWAAYLRQR